MRSISGKSRAPFLVVFDKDDDVLPTLRSFADSHGIRGGSFIGIGGFRRATIAYWNPQTKEYEHIEVKEQVEVLSMAGDIGVTGDETRLHAHVTLGRRDGSTIGGHLVAGTVFPTLEMQVVDLGVEITRAIDEETGLSLIRSN